MNQDITHLLTHNHSQPMHPPSFSYPHSEGLKEGMGEFFSICSVPEAPKLGFFKNFFSGSNAVVDREEICEFFCTQ